MKIQNPNCAGGKCREPRGEVRILPTGGDSNAILCKSCFQREMTFRWDRNRTLGNDFKFKLPAWLDLEVYETGALV